MLPFFNEQFFLTMNKQTNQRCPKHTPLAEVIMIITIYITQNVILATVRKREILKRKKNLATVIKRAILKRKNNLATVIKTERYLKGKQIYINI